VKVPCSKKEPSAGILSGGIYIHVPFCIQKCLYCDFYSITDLSVADAFLYAVRTEIRLRNNTDKLFDTIYIGGGTPSALKPPKIKTILNDVFSSFVIARNAEVTMEINPGTVDLADLKAYREMGVNRLSIGVQSFSESNLRFLGRIHTAGDARKTIMAARSSGFSNISLDFISGLPGQTEKSWINDLEQALVFAPEHLSCYMLTYEPGTPLDQKRKKNLFTPLDEPKAGGLFSITRQFLSRNGYQQYEISNYARSETFYSSHNRKYWRFHPYLGFGPAAHSYSDNIRSWNHRSVETYIENLSREKLPVDNTEILNREQQIMEFIYLGLRQTDGISMDDFYQRFGRRFETVFSDTIAFLKNRQWLRIQKGQCFLTTSGMLLLDSIADMFLQHELS
jgi:oxygen-independent coproporphyrinogen-3 oxidase